MSIRLTYFLSFLIICLLLLTSIYLEFFQGIMPCPLCTLQRGAFALLGLLLLLGALFSAYRLPRLCINLISLITATGGLALAGRQVWLQHFPPTDGSECGVSLNYMMKVLPLNEVMHKVLLGTAECTARSWDFLSLDMAEWSMLWFSLFILITLYLCQVEYKKR